MAEGSESHTSVTRLLDLCRGNPQYMVELEKFRRATVVMFTDIKGSTAYFEKYGDVAGLMMVHECNRMLQEAVEKHGGRLIKTIGDAIMAVFDDCRHSVLAAIDMQRRLAEFNAPRPEPERVMIRIGLHYGAGIVKSDDVFGDVVNVASRVEGVAVPEQIVISDSLYQQVRGFEFHITHLGKFALKGKEGERDLFEVVWNEQAAARDYATHTLVTRVGKLAVPLGFKLQHLNEDGSVAAEHQLSKALTVGSSSADVKIPSDPALAPVHARFSLSGAQVFVDDLTNGGGDVFVRLVATYTLHDQDVVIMGQELFRFTEQRDVLSAAAAVGTKLEHISNIIDEPVAQLLRLNESGKPSGSYPLKVEEVRFGRSNGTYTFPADKLMSRAHARVFQRGEDFFLEDLGSRNGTFVKVRGRAPVPMGASVLLGNQIFKIAR